MTARLLSVAHGADFLRTVAEELWCQVDGNPERLAQSKVILPTRRAARTFMREMLRASGFEAMLMPEIITLSDQTLLSDELDDEVQHSLVTRMKMVDVLRHHGLSASEALGLAESLYPILRQLALYEVGLETVLAVFSADHVLHWQQASHYLEILLRADILTHFQGPQRLLCRLLEHFQEAPPKGFVVIAGLVSSYPKALALYEYVRSHPSGIIFFPALFEIDGPLKDSHPMAILARILSHLGVDPTALRCIGELPLADLSMRVRLLDAAFAEAGLKLDQAKEALEKNALQDVSLLEAADEAEEAELIALHIRDLLARGEQKIALITPHRPLANRVMAELKACHIEADDTAGLPLRHTEAGVLTLLALDVLTGERSAHALLALLKHPLVCLEETRAVHLHKVRQMELEARHPQRPIPLSQQSMIRHVLAQLPPTHSSLPLAEWIAHLQHFLMRLMGPLSGSGVGAEAVQDLFDLFSAHLSSMDADAFRRLLADAVFSAAVRPPFDADPRVQVVGVFEAQFQHFECVILAGLVEGIWPGGSHDDPWLPGPVRVALGLPSSAQTISLMADVFCQQMGTPKVLMTRSRKMGGAPVMASRFLERLDTVLLAAQARPLWRTREEVLGWRQVLRQVDHVTPIQAPQPSPDATLRPKEFSATQLRLLMQNPYGFYAQQILQLIPLASLEQDLGPAELGSVLHAILEQDVRAGWHTLPDRLERLHHLALKMLTPWGHLPWVQHFVLPRVDLMLMHYVQHAQTTFEQVPLRFSELNGETTLACGDEVYRLRAKLDLLALTPSGAHVVDYKTGLLPSKKAVDRGEDPQLFMEAYLVARGGYGDLPAQLPQKAELWRLTTQGIEVLAAPGDMAQWLQQCEEVIEAVLAHYGAGGPMIAPTQMPSGWVRHLGRVDEWHT